MTAKPKKRSYPAQRARRFAWTAYQERCLARMIADGRTVQEMATEIGCTFFQMQAKMANRAQWLPSATSTSHQPKETTHGRP